MYAVSCHNTQYLSDHQVVVHGQECEGPNCRGVFDVATEDGSMLFSATQALRMPALAELLDAIPRDSQPTD